MRFTRRQALKAGGATLGALALGGCGSGSNGGSSGGKVTLRMFVFLGADLADMPKAFAAEYERAHPNVKLEIYEDSNTVGYPKMVAAKRANPKKPFVNLGFFNAQTTAQGEKEGMWAKLDYGRMRNAASVLDQFKRANQQGIGIGADQFGLLYNTDEVKAKPDSWAALWDPAYRGKVTFFDYSWWVVYVAAQLNGGSLDDMEPGWRLWKENAKQLRNIVSSNPEYLNVLSNGTATLTSYFNGTGHQWIAGGAPIEYAVPTEGAISVPVYLQSVAGQSDDELEACQDVIDQMISPKWCAEWARTSIEVPANEGAKLPPKLAALPAFQRRTIDDFLTVDWAKVGASTADWKSRWDRDIKANI